MYKETRTQTAAADASRTPPRHSASPDGGPSSCMLYARESADRTQRGAGPPEKAGRTVKVLANLLRGVNVRWTVEVGFIGRQQGDHTQKLQDYIKEWSK